MQLFVRAQGTHVFEADASSTVDDVKAFVAAAEGIAVEDQYLVSAGRPLEYGLLDVSPLSTIEVGVRMLGGKVHGSLARAGKVKGQTPKVEKQEKKKVKTGRAKRRMQYNKRVVNVVTGLGKKRGPNSQSQ
ncbi:uncharacterized protein MONBRDRAFT_31020 [Monosiga brevicollis MX1]|uniref:Ubiquitin-like domain-containing protein n=1 Tax=Monosiga brevicollis TaxID=81824 RepID=A9UQS5_MONBE|nr:uncharacterized protein MONBRDRAFT_31020 [Monosiga brevicollis MX1]EDQ92648.1 predicted protein [Monosiga brevicollis MX1]|eukprot:XP_001742410.1 hypothetical protein [Monosiga brevicollis MX1]